MSNVHELPKRSDTTLEASEWIARTERGLTDQEEEALQNWLAAGPENLAMFLKMAELWDKMDSLARLADLFPKAVNHRTRSLRVPLAMAASVLLAILIGLLSINPSGLDPQSPLVNAVGEQVFETEVGEQSTFVLPDGSELTLNTNSLIRSRFSNSQRTLVLERGEAHMRVAHEKLRPFSVYVGNQIIQAVGTEFNLEISSAEQIELIVNEGKVLVGLRGGKLEPAGLTDLSESSLSLAESPRVLVAGELLVLGDIDQEVEQLEPEEIEVKLSWRGGNLVFRGESLAEAITEIERYTPIEFVIMDENLKKVRVAGLFKAGDVEGLLMTLRENFNVANERVSEEKIILTNH